MLTVFVWIMDARLESIRSFLKVLFFVSSYLVGRHHMRANRTTREALFC